MPKNDAVNLAEKYQPTEITSASSENGITDPRNVDPSLWLDEYGDILYKYAVARVKSQELAEDLVQEALLSGIKAYDRFEGRCTVKTWLVGILKNKIIDHFRSVSRKGIPDDLDDKDVHTQNYFNSFGIWRVILENWADSPDEILEKRDFYKVFEGCLGKLPEQSRKAFLMKMSGEKESAEVCNILGISSSNYWVLLYRARLALRECIEINWIQQNR